MLASGAIPTELARAARKLLVSVLLNFQLMNAKTTQLENEFFSTGKSWCALDPPSFRTGVASTTVTYCIASLTTKVNFRSGAPDAEDTGHDMMQRGRMEKNETGEQ